MLFSDSQYLIAVDVKMQHPEYVAYYLIRPRERMKSGELNVKLKAKTTINQKRTVFCKCFLLLLLPLD